jgi:hypothetical protein
LFRAAYAATFTRRRSTAFAAGPFDWEMAMRSQRTLRTILVAGSLAALSVVTFVTTVLGVTTGGGWPR